MKNKKHKKQIKKEVQCLNCGTPLQDKFCAACGQKAFLQKEHFFHLAFEFIADYFHYDGKFFSTLKGLIRKPGFLTLEYIEGRRKRYLNPIQLYIFVSAMFFLVLMKLATLYGSLDYSREDVLKQYNLIEKQRDSIRKHVSYKSNPLIELSELGYTINKCVFTLKEYDSIEKTLPLEQRETGFTRYFHRRSLKFNDKHVYYDDVLSLSLPQTIIQSLPKVLFLLLPLFALILYLFFRKNVYFDHLIFSLHFHVMLFLILMLYLTLAHFIESDILNYVLTGATLVAILTFLFLSLKTVYPSKIRVLLLKFLGVFVIYSTIFLGIGFAVILANLMWL